METEISFIYLITAIQITANKVNDGTFEQEKQFQYQNILT
jgi:hypothetical protein